MKRPLFVTAPSPLFHNILASERPGYSMFPILDPVELLDIDYPRDLDLAEYIPKNNLYDFGFSSCRHLFKLVGMPTANRIWFWTLSVPNLS